MEVHPPEPSPASSSQPATTTQEPKSNMLDVHPPHHAANTWRDFFIHMATVCLGLLIAIGLEQSVEALHRNHQRHQLEQDLRAEAIQNLRIAIYNLNGIENLDTWQSQQAAELDRASAEDRAPRYIPLPLAYHVRLPSEAVWTVAQTGTLNLLPRTEAQQYAHPYSVARFAADDVPRLNLLMNERDEILDGASSVPYSSRLAGADNNYDLSRLSKENRARLREVTASIVAQARRSETDNINLYGFTWGTLHGYSDDQNYHRRREVFTAYRHDGGTAAIMKKFPIPDENSASAQEDK